MYLKNNIRCKVIEKPLKWILRKLQSPINHLHVITWPSDFCQWVFLAIYLSSRGQAVYVL